MCVGLLYNASEVERERFRHLAGIKFPLFTFSHRNKATKILSVLIQRGCNDGKIGNQYQSLSKELEAIRELYHRYQYLIKGSKLTKQFENSILHIKTSKLNNTWLSCANRQFENR